MKTLAIMAEQLLRQVRARLQYVDAQLAGGADEGMWLGKATDALEMAFRECGVCDLAELTEVTEEINKGPWSPHDRLRLATALSDNFARFENNGEVNKAENTQTLDAPENYLTMPEWTSLQSPRLTELAKIEVLANRWYKLGLTCPNEQTLKRGGCIIVGLVYGMSTLRSRRSGPSAGTSNNMLRIWRNKGASGRAAS